MIETVQALKKVPLFTNLSDAELKLLSSASSVKAFVKNQIIIHKSDEGDTFFSILSGKVKVVLTDEEGREYIVGILKQNEFFGELALLDGEPRSASVVAMTRTEVVVVGACGATDAWRIGSGVCACASMRWRIVISSFSIRSRWAIASES